MRKFTRRSEEIEIELIDGSEKKTKLWEFTPIGYEKWAGLVLKQDKILDKFREKHATILFEVDEAQKKNIKDGTEIPDELIKKMNALAEKTIEEKESGDLFKIGKEIWKIMLNTKKDEDVDFINKIYPSELPKIFEFFLEMNDLLKNVKKNQEVELGNLENVGNLMKLQSF